jgi:O-antigen ligase
MIKCGSRTSILSLSAGLIVFSLLTLFRERKIAIKSFNKEAPLVIGTLIVGIFFASSLQFVSNIQFLNPNSLTFRGQIWQTSSILFSDSTTFGLGWDWESRAIASNLLNIWAVSAHNVLLEVLFSSGLVGLVLFLLLIAKGIVYFYNLEKVEKAILSSFIFSGVSESIINFQYPSLTTYMFSFIILGANKMKSQN